MSDKTQSKVALKVKWLFHYLGFIIERVPDENKLFFELNNTHEAIQKHVLKRLTDNIRIANNHRLYNRLLKRYVPKWDSNPTTARFMGNGVGEYSFNTFRKVYFKDKCYFEKVYFNNTYDLSRIEWFYKHINPLLKDSINVAKLYRIIKGDLITIVYFEFAELIPLSRATLNSVSFDISKTLIEISGANYVKEIRETAPSYLKDYKLHAYYKGNITLATKMIKELSNNRLTPRLIEQVINLQPLVLTHGDIQETNLFANNYLIDWDSFGFFPLGLETAYILCKNEFFSHKREESLTSQDLQKILVENYKTVINKDQWVSFELSCFYFYFIFIALDDGTPPNIALQKDLFDRVEQLYKDASRTNNKKRADLYDELLTEKCKDSNRK